MNYYGDKISKNMILTPEGYLVCRNVPIGRTGYMEYLGRELPFAFKEPTGEVFKVYRRPEELFSEATIASFEGKPVTNQHPVANLDVHTAPMTTRGHAQNIRREGDFLIADLYVEDAGLISEIQNELKREVSSGYDCSWHKIGKGEYEQREIIGNHVAVVQNGRAGPKVAIHDSVSDEKLITDEKPKTGGKKKMKITQKMLAAIGFKQFAQDAEPEDIAKAMDALNEEEAEKKDVKDGSPDPEKKDPDPEKKEVKDEMPAWAQQLVSEVQALRAEVKDSKPEDKETAESIMDATAEELEKEVKDEEPDDKKDEKKDPVKDSGPDPEKKGAADAGLKKFVADMKPIIMAIPDEKSRLKAAKDFRSAVKDAQAFRSANGYGDILTAVATNKKTAMDTQVKPTQSVSERAEAACKAWGESGDKMKGGK